MPLSSIGTRFLGVKRSAKFEQICEILDSTEVQAAEPEIKAITQAALDAARGRFEEAAKGLIEALPALTEIFMGPLKGSWKRWGKRFSWV